MAPSEFDLRAALREGEGDGVDAGRVIARARAVRATRRTRWATAAATVVVVGALGTGIGALVHSSGTGSAGSAGGANAADSAAGAEAGAPGAAPEPAAPGATGAFHGPVPGAQDASGSATDMCPSQPPSVRVPDPGARGTSDPLFTRTVTSATVCGFRAKQAGGAPVFDRGTVLTGVPAQRLADSLDTASSEFHAIICPGDPYATRLVVYARSRSHEEAPVLINLTCGVSLTNGTAARYDWTPPADLAAKLAALTRP